MGGHSDTATESPKTEHPTMSLAQTVVFNLGTVGILIGALFGFMHKPEKASDNEKTIPCEKRPDNEKNGDCNKPATLAQFIFVWLKIFFEVCVSMLQFWFVVYLPGMLIIALREIIIRFM